MKTITATTTDEQILTGVEHAKNELAKFAAAVLTTPFMEGNKLVKMATAVKVAEDLASVQMRYRNLLEASNNSTVEALFFLVQTAAATNDTWSGRTNDSIRASQDAIRDWARRTAEDVKYGN